VDQTLTDDEEIGFSVAFCESLFSR